MLLRVQGEWGGGVWRGAIAAVGRGHLVDQVEAWELCCPGPWRPVCLSAHTGWGWGWGRLMGPSPDSLLLWVPGPGGQSWSLQPLSPEGRPSIPSSEALELSRSVLQYLFCLLLVPENVPSGPGNRWKWVSPAAAGLLWGCGAWEVTHPLPVTTARDRITQRLPAHRRVCWVQPGVGGGKGRG